MADLKKIGMAAGTFSVALGIGFVMQNGDALASRFGTDTAVEQPAPFSEQSAPVEVVENPAAVLPEDQVSVEVAIETTQGSVLPTAPVIETPDPVIEAAVILPETAKIPAPQAAPVQLANLDDPELAPEIETDVIATAELDCVPAMAGAPGAAASVVVSVAAPCHSASPFVIHHQGMMFTAMTDVDGNAELTVPALAEVAVLIAAFDDGNGAVATTTVPDFAAYDRAVLQWQGDTSVMLSAYENEAGFGDANHIHAGNPGDMDRLNAAQGGYLVSLGDATQSDALRAEVYTFPSGMVVGSADVMLVAEAEITSFNCGKEINAQSIQISPTGSTSALDLSMMMPACDAVGDFLILQNMFEDLTLASK